MGEGSHPERVKVYGPGVEKTGLKANEPTYFTVDCSEAGQGVPGCGQGSGRGLGRWGLHSGQILLLAKWGRPLRTHSWPCACLPSGDVSIGIKCAPGVVGPAEADIDFDIIKNDNDTFTVKYTPPGAGRYTIMVLFANQVPYPWLLAITGGLQPPSLSRSFISCPLGTVAQPSTEHFLCAGGGPQKEQRGCFRSHLCLP